MFLDEPELGLHPHAISLIADMMKRLAQTRQVIIATQPPYLLDQFGLDNVIVTDLVEGATRFQTLDREQYQRWLDDEYRISDIWLKDAVGSQH